MSFRTINSIRNPRWADAGHTLLNVDVDFDEIDDEFVPFTTSANADTEHGRFIWGEAMSGEFDPIAEYVAPPPPPVLLYPADLWRRVTDDEAAQIDAAMSAQSVKLRNLFLTAQYFTSDNPLWPVLQQAATALFGAQRAAEILAPSV